MYKILIVEDDLNLGTTLSSVLESQNYKVSYLTGGSKLMQELKLFVPDIILMDVVLNEPLDGFDLGKQIRTLTNTPIIFATSRDGNDDFKTGFSIPNSDYIRKPYKLMEVVLRIEKLLAKKKVAEAYQLGDLCFFPGEQSLKYDCRNIHLNNYESAVLTLLCNNLGTFVNKREIIIKVWNENEYSLKEGSLNNILSNLRKYLQTENRIHLETKIGLGVRLVIQDDNTQV